MISLEDLKAAHKRLSEIADDDNTTPEELMDAWGKDHGCDPDALEETVEVVVTGMLEGMLEGTPLEGKAAQAVAPAPFYAAVFWALMIGLETGLTIVKDSDLPDPDNVLADDNTEGGEK